MLKIGLTGSIGSGKSTIAKVFSSLEIPVYISDIEAKKILDFPDIIDKVKKKFGDDVLNDNGFVNRKELAGRVFNNTEALQWLNGLIHPRVRKHFLEWVENHNTSPYIMQESAIMLETGFSSFFNKIIVVTCPVDQRYERVKNRDNMTKSQFDERMENQWPEELKVKMADYIIKNDDDCLAVPQVLKIHNELLGLSMTHKGS
jgi:dephospho-CoA kinase